MEKTAYKSDLQFKKIIILGVNPYYLGNYKSLFKPVWKTPTVDLMMKPKKKKLLKSDFCSHHNFETKRATTNVLALEL